MKFWLAILRVAPILLVLFAVVIAVVQVASFASMPPEVRDVAPMAFTMMALSTAILVLFALILGALCFWVSKLAQQAFPEVND